MRIAAVVALLVLSAAVEAATPTPSPPPAGAPVYEAAPCCQLCPHAADPEAYDFSKTASDFRHLVDGRNHWLFRTGLDLTTTFDLNEDSLPELRRLVSTLRARGTQLVIVYQPPRGLMDVHQLTVEQRAQYDFELAKRSYANALARLRSTGAIVPPLEQLADEPDDYDYYFRRDHHWTPTGAEHTAKIVSGAIRTLPVYASLPHREFSTHAVGIIAKPGTLQKIAMPICGGAYSMQYLPAFVTDSAGGGDLLGDEAAPEVALVGTSNSDAKGGYNFAGWLEQFLSTDVLDVAITGGSFEGSLLHYLPSESFQKHPPKIIVWEMPYQDYPNSEKNPHKIFRQAVPLVNDGCHNKPVLMSKTLALQAGSNETLFNGGGRILPLVSKTLQMDIQFSDPSIKTFTGTIWYLNGLKENLKLEFKQYVDNGGRFVAELRNDRPDYADATMLALTVDLDQPPPKPLTVTAKLCAR